MTKCMSCGKTSLLTTNFGNVVLCKNCSALVNVSVWKSRDFTSINELLNQKNDAIRRANDNNMPLMIVDEINRYFDEYINAGFITSINGKAGQTIKMFESHCIITTKSETKKTELINMFYQFVDCDEDDEDDNQILSSNDKQSLVNGLLSGKIVQAGIGVVLSATLNQYENEKSAEKKSRIMHKKLDKLITVGERRVDLRKISGVEIFSRPNTANGYLRFINKGNEGNTLFNCEYFFFNNSIPFESRRIKQRIEKIKNMLDEKITTIEYEVLNVHSKSSLEPLEEQITQQDMPDVFDEIRKYKQLLDEGIISEDEFNIKKKQLLRL